MGEGRGGWQSAVSRMWAHSWVWLLGAVLCVAFFWDVLVAPGDQIVGGHDLSDMFRIWLDFARSAIRQGELPLWNPYVFSGTPFVSDPQPAIFYPPTWIAMVLPTTRGLGILVVLHVWWSLVGATQWLRSETAYDGQPLSRGGAFAGALVYAFSGYVFARVQAGHLGVIMTGAWLPWGLWALRRIAQRLDSRSVAVGGLCVGMAILAGHSATLIYVGLVWLAYGLTLVFAAAPLERRRRLLLFAGAGALGMALASVQLLPLLSGLLSSTRASQSDYAFASRFSWPVGYLITLLVPNFFGEPVRTGYWGDGVYEEMIYYVGILPLLLGWVTWRAQRVVGWSRQTVFWAAASGLAILTAFGSNGIVHRLFYRFLPGFAMMRAPARAGLVLTCSVAALVAVALTTLERASTEERKALVLPLLRASSVRTVLLATTLSVMGCYLAYGFAKDTNPEIGRLWHTAGQLALFGLLYALASGYLRQWLSPILPKWLLALAAGLILLDLWTLGASLVTVVPAPLSAYWRIVAQHIEGRSGRVLPWGLTYHEQNGAISYGVRSVFGYNPLEDEAYNAFTTSNPDPRARVYDLLNVRYVSTTTPLTLNESDTLALLAEESGVYVYERATAQPRAWFVAGTVTASEAETIAGINHPDFDPYETAFVTSGDGRCSGSGSGRITVEQETGNTLVARVEGAGGLAVFSERFAPGWRATIDGQDAPILRVDGLLRGICVPEGEHTVAFAFRPFTLYLGACVSGLALIVATFLSSRRTIGHRQFHG